MVSGFPFGRGLALPAMHARVPILAPWILAWCLVTPATAAWFQQPLVFVGRDHVDLHWDLQASYDGYRILRDGTQISPDLDLHTDRYRDSDLLEGATHTYQLSAFRRDGTAKWSSIQSATAGRISGTLYQDLTWDSGLYRLLSDVRVARGISLQIHNSAHVQRLDPNSTTALKITDELGGAITIAGSAIIQVPVHFLQPTSNVRNATFTTPGTLHLLGNTGGGLIQDNRFVELAAVRVSGSAPYDFSHNQFEDATLTISANADCELTCNEFQHTRVEFLIDATVTLLTNRFVDSRLLIQTSGTVLVRRNEFILDTVDPQSANPQSIYADAAQLHLEENYCIVSSAVGHPYGTAMNLGSTDNAKRMVVAGNLIAGFATGIRCWGNPVIQIVDNTIRHNAAGIYIHGDPQVTLRANCISGNAPGAPDHTRGGLITYARTMPLLSENDYWGDPSGPTHPSHPSGRGDTIKEWDVAWNANPGLVDFSAFTTTDNCRAVYNPPDLRVVQLTIVQVVEGVLELVQAKPVAVKAVIASTQPTPAPFGVRLDFEGTTLTEFFELRPDNLTPELQLADSSTSLQFSATGEKTIYFFPSAIPFDLERGASATLTLDPANQIIEPDETNNTHTVHQPVVQTRWHDDPGYPFPQVLFLGVALTGMPYSASWLKDMVTAFDLAGSFLPVAPIDYRWRSLEMTPSATSPKPDGPYRADRFREHKAAEPGLNRAVVVFQLDRLPPPTNPYQSVHENFVVALYFLRGVQEPPDTFGLGLSLVLTTYGLQIATNRVAVAGGIDVLNRRVLDNELAQEVHGQNVYSVMGQLDSDEWFWLDRSSYQTLLQRRRAPATRSSLGLLGGPGNHPIAIVSGRLTRAGMVQLDPLIVLPEGLAEPPKTGDYQVHLLDSAGQSLGSWSFAPDFVSFGPEGPIETASAEFFFALPWIEAARELTINYQGQVIDRLRASAHPPEVRVLFPAGGEALAGTVTLSWSGSDADGDRLTYGVFFSADDGHSWEPLAIDLAETSLAWDTSQHTGGTQCRIKILAGDGFHTREALSEGRFAIPHKAPQVWITSPIANALIQTGRPFPFYAFGWSTDDRLLPDDALVWSSTLDGFLGRGASGSFVLSPGNHTVSLTGTDSAGSTAQTQIPVRVQSWVLPDAAIQRSGFRFPTEFRVGFNHPMTVRIDNFGPTCTANLVVLLNSAVQTSIPLDLKGYQSQDVTFAWRPDRDGFFHFDFCLRDITPADALSGNDAADAWLEVHAPDPGNEYDSDGDGLPNWWEYLYFGGLAIADPEADPDRDGLKNLAEYLCGTDPTRAESVLRIADLAIDAEGRLRLRWQSIPGRSYQIHEAPAATGPFVPLIRLQADRPRQERILPIPVLESRFYRVQHE
jgi:hypothetical protein